MENIYFDIKKLKYLGENVIIGKTVRIRKPELCIIGDGTIIDDFTYISCALETGKNCHIASNVTLSGGSAKLILGDHTGIGASSTVHCESSDFTKVELDMPSAPDGMDEEREKIRDVRMGSLILVGAHCCVLPGANLPHGTAFGSYSLIKNIKYEPWTLYAGNPKIKALGLRDTSKIVNTKYYKELVW
jgi:acetyltransferase-like isoleucine patch superfamily enzyme